MSIETNLDVCGIYSIKHLDSGRVYIGSSISVKNRVRKHRESLVRGAHHSKHLQRTFDKYGQDAFSVEVLLICEQSDLLMYEQRCIDGFAPAFNGSKSANSPVHRGQKLPEEWRKKVQASVRQRYAEGFKVVHPPRSEAYRAAVSNESKKQWKKVEVREKILEAIRSAMTEEECQKKSERAKRLWANPEYKAKAIASRKGKAYNKGYKCTPEQIENRRKAARISNAKRHHGENWKTVYAQRYPEHTGDLNGK